MHDACCLLTVWVLVMNPCAGGSTANACITTTTTTCGVDAIHHHMLLLVLLCSCRLPLSSVPAEGPCHLQ
jgi:hypothetical protein